MTKNYAELIQGINQGIPDNNQGIVSPADVRQNMIDLADWAIELPDIENVKGAYNASTNTPTLTATPDPTFNDGAYYDVTVSGAVGFAGSNFTSGTILNVLDKLKKKGAQWYRIPFDFDSFYNVFSQRYFIDVKPVVISSGTILGTPTSLTCYIAPAGTYTLPSGNVTLTGNINFFFWDFSSGWTYQSFDVAVKDNTITTSKIADEAVTNEKLAIDSVSTDNLQDKSVTAEKVAFFSTKINGGNLDIVAKEESGRRVRIARMNKMGYWKIKLDTRSIENNSLTQEKLSTELNDLLNLLKMFRIDSNSYGAKDILKIVSANKRKVLTITKEAELKALFNFTLRKIRKQDISDDIFIPDKFSIGYRKFIAKIRVLGADGRWKIVFGVKKDGTLVGKFDLAPKSISVSHLEDTLQERIPTVDFIRKNSYNSNDYIVVEDYDENYNTEVIDFPIYTSSSNGVLFKQLAPLKTKSINIQNNTGVDLEVTNTPSIVVKGKNARGSFTPINSAILQNYKGWFLYNSSQLPQNPTVGDYYLCMFFYNVSKTATIGGVTFSEWDVLYFDGAWKVQTCPVTSTTLIESDFFDVSSNGKYWNIDLKSGDKLIFLGIKAGGGWNEPVFVTQKEGDFFYRGLCNPASFSVGVLNNMDLCVVSSNGTVGAFAVNRGDYLYKEDGLVGIVNNPIKVIYNGYSMSMSCKNTSDLAIRRADTQNLKTQVTAKSKVTTKVRAIGHDLVLVSDSMFGTNVGQSIANIFSDRNTAIESYGGADSNNILVMLKKLLYSDNDYVGRIYNFWHGQNNNTDVTQIKAVALEFVSLISNANYKFTMWSVLGNINASWNGTRIVCPVHENATAGNTDSPYIQVESWYDKVFKGKHFPTRKMALQASSGRNTPHLQFPGLTEAQVAQLYGIPAFSFWFRYDTVDWKPNELFFTGYHSNSGLPSGGGNLDYKIRIANGTVGNIIVKYNGIWVEYSHDTVHVSKEGGDAIALQYKLFFQNLNY